MEKLSARSAGRFRETGLFLLVWTVWFLGLACARLLLKNLEGETDRAAEFVCAAALVDAERELVVRGVWPGEVLEAPSGTHGFGYDPVFHPQGIATSSAELTPEEKNAISHSSRAFGALVEQLRVLYG